MTSFLKKKEIIQKFHIVIELWYFCEDNFFITHYILVLQLKMSATVYDNKVTTAELRVR